MKFTLHSLLTTILPSSCSHFSLDFNKSSLTKPNLTSLSLEKPKDLKGKSLKPDHSIKNFIAASASQNKVEK